MIELIYLDVDIENLTKEIQDSIEWLATTEGDEVECIGIENLEGILTRFLNTSIKLTENESNEL